LPLLQEVKRYFDEHAAPAGYNVGWDVGRVAGQVIDHVRMYVISRWADETLAGRGIRYRLKQPANRRHSGLLDNCSKEPQTSRGTCMFARAGEAVLVGSGVIITPESHRVTVFDLTPDEWRDTYFLLGDVQRLLDARYHPDGYTLGWNCGRVAGKRRFKSICTLFPVIPMNLWQARVFRISYGSLVNEGHSLLVRIEHAAVRLGLDLAAFTRTEVLSTRHGHCVWRVWTSTGSSVAKWFPDDATAAVEISAYQLLHELGVPTLHVYSTTNDSLLLEDLGSSPRLRAATADDMARAEVGAAVGRWYKTFHQRGSKWLARKIGRPSVFTRETDILTVQAVTEAATALGLMDSPVWDMVIHSLDLLKRAVSLLGVTLCYNDFYWTNLALSRNEENGFEAVVYDYHLLGIGMRYSDYRNVVSALGPAAATAFGEEFGEIDPREQVLDKPLETLHSLVVASRLPQLTGWAQESRDAVINGDLLQHFREAEQLAAALV
jgi:diadenosine tetraphosphate (Ap4A) HIT family hydrolase